MAADAADLAGLGPEYPAYAIGVAPGHVEERRLPGGRVMRHRGLDEVAGAIQLVAPREVGPALVWPGDNEIAVHVAVRPLRLRYKANDLVDPGL